MHANFWYPLPLYVSHYLTRAEMKTPSFTVIGDDSEDGLDEDAAGELYLTSIQGWRSTWYLTSLLLFLSLMLLSTSLPDAHRIGELSCNTFQNGFWFYLPRNPSQSWCEQFAADKSHSYMYWART